MASIKSTLMLTNALQMLNIHVGLTNIKTLLRNDPPASLRLQMPGASSLSHIWLTTVDIKELSNGRVIWLHLVVLSCTLISLVPASTTAVSHATMQPCQRRELKCSWACKCFYQACINEKCISQLVSNVLYLLVSNRWQWWILKLHKEILFNAATSTELLCASRLLPWWWKATKIDYTNPSNLTVYSMVKRHP